LILILNFITMRRLTISLVLAAFALSSLAAQDLDKILNDHFKASAQEKMSNITSTTMKGKVVAMGMETEITILQARPSNLRLETVIMGSDMIQTYNGTTGWTYAPAMGVPEPKEMGTEEVKIVLDQANMDSPLWGYKEKGNNLELLGTSEDGSAYKIKLTKAEGAEMVILISKESSLMTKLITSQSVNGMDTELEMEMKDYKTIKGVPVAHYMGSKMSGQLFSTITYESIEFNKTLDPSLFGKPVVE
jgi:outer membrane lipoprotein-sorting protein